MEIEKPFGLVYYYIGIVSNYKEEDGIGRRRRLQ